MSMSACTIFTTALCNLDCKYCYICKDKNGGLKQIDDDLAEMLESGQYLQQVLDYGEDIQETLTDICLWGGEPVLYLERFTNQIENWFNAFPNIKSFMISTNNTVENSVEKIQDLLQAIDKYGPKDSYQFDLQLSIDGYEEMNDSGRGQGTTKKFLDNFYKLFNIKYNHHKINLNVHTKPTLSRETFCYLDTPEKCKQWIEFFTNEMYLPYEQASVKFRFRPSLFNCAQPTEWTKDDGLYFAKISNYLAQFHPSDYSGWETHYSFVPMAHMIIESYVEGADYSKPMCGGTCGAYVHEVNPIPHGKYTACHRGLFDDYVEYCNNTNNLDYMNGLSKAYFAPRDRAAWLMTLDELKEKHKYFSHMINCPQHVRYTDYIIFIREYARQGIIDKRYFNVEEIEKTLGYYLSTSYCMQNGFAQTGSWTTMDSYEIPLMYNGAMECAIKELDKYKERLGQI